MQDDSYLKAKYDGNQLRCIGKGGFGKVFFGVKKDGTGPYAVKVVETLSQEELNYALGEIINLSNLKENPNIMSYNSYWQNHVILENKNSLYQIFIELPLASNTLSNVLTIKGKLQEDCVTRFLGQIISGLKYAHDKHFVHLDLKPENILLMGEICKICDWGGSFRVKSSNTTKTIKSKIQATQGYHAPEIDQQIYGENSTINYYLCDIYSLGTIALRMCGISEETLLSVPKQHKKYHDLSMNEDIFGKLEKQYSQSLLNMLKKMTLFEAKGRSSLDEVIESFNKL